MPDVFEPLTRCGADTSMGRLLREYWIPAVPSSALAADGAPYKFRLLGEHLVAFRATDGRAGVVDQACPHRGASLVLARNEECGLRCLYHGWKLDVEGRVVDTPREHDPNYGNRIRPTGHPTEERGGIVWTYLGSQRPAPPFPPYPFTQLPDDQVGTISVPVRCNWLVGLEAAFDPTHTPILHRSSLNPAAPVSGTLLGLPLYEAFDVERQPYGFRMAASAPVDDHVKTVRTKEYLFPFLRMNSQTADEDGDLVVFGQVPVDDESMMFWFILYNHDHAPGTVGYPIQARGPTGIRALDSFGSEFNWGQDRSAMAHHFTGLSLEEPALGVVFEDLAMMESMSETLDRTRHNLTPADGMLTKSRHLVRVILDDYEKGRGAPDHSGVGSLHPRFLVIDRDDTWRNHYPKPLSESTASTT